MIGGAAATGLGLAQGAGLFGGAGAAGAGAGIGGAASWISGAADPEVKNIENPFGQGTLPQVLQTAQTNPALARQQFIQGYTNYLNAQNANIHKGGKDALVSRQSLTQNPALRQTAETIAQQIG